MADYQATLDKDSRQIMHGVSSSQLPLLFTRYVTTMLLILLCTENKLQSRCLCNLIYSSKTLCSHFTDVESESLRSQLTCLHSWESLDLNLSLFNSKMCPLTYMLCCYHASWLLANFPCPKVEIMYMKVVTYVKTLYRCWLLLQVVLSAPLTNELAFDHMTKMQPNDGRIFKTDPPTLLTFSW